MNKLERLDSCILGSAADVEALAQASSARLLVLSDTHGHYDVFEAIMRDWGSSCDALLFAGDGMWDIVQYLENAIDSDRLLAPLPPVIAYVAGNGDGDQYRVTLPVKGDFLNEDEAPGFPLMVPSRQIVRACGFNILLVHGHRHSVDVSLEMLVDSAENLSCDIVVFGHTHIQFIEEFSTILALNPGSPARPRGHSAPGFAVIELDAAVTTPRVEFYRVNEGLLGGWSFEPVDAR